ncbi:hypothetical protein GALMADRAFT_143869 [Galerina marginata CBS 339.88]|uniref:DyP dimeric alpha+beta barrel domain-containing protein n=1 Tax=Galerina marginata (strain CBS 339.88) TaxID=685588 RepID=A0A067SL34_GALM3|nr:hypothetical protein GALMADRAFT_143869 [Galerina marginata CBS 339.88]
MATQQTLPPVTLPPPTPPNSAPTPVALKLENIQGDILSGLPKKTETLYFFQITDAVKFREDLKKIIPLVKSVAQVLKDREEIEKHKRGHGLHGFRSILIPLVGVNISFSHFGFKKLGIDDTKLVDTAFLNGQRFEAGANLGDKGTGSGQDFVPDWEEPFKKEIHGVIILAGDSHASVDKKLQEIKLIFDVGGRTSSIAEITSVQGDARPGDQSAHEHFGYLDGVSNPAIIGFDTNPPPGPAPIRAGAIILGQDGDNSISERAPWMVDGSFLVFRYLFQKVPEFDDFVFRNRLKGPGMSDKEGADLLGARLIGRWKSGAMTQNSELIRKGKKLVESLNIPWLTLPPCRNNNFHFSAERNFQKLCPFAAHIRKTLPRADLESLGLGISLETTRIMRRGIQFGPEVTKTEKLAKKTFHGRGLIFACYQSSIISGFQFLQSGRINNATFPFAENTPEVPGVDPILGQGEDRKLSGTDPNNPAAELNLDDEWVIPRGGEYFFSPSIQGLTNTIAA